MSHFVNRLSYFCRLVSHFCRLVVFFVDQLSHFSRSVVSFIDRLSHCCRYLGTLNSDPDPPGMLTPALCPPGSSYPAPGFSETPFASNPQGMSLQDNCGKCKKKFPDSYRYMCSINSCHCSTDFCSSTLEKSVELPLLIIV